MNATWIDRALPGARGLSSRPLRSGLLLAVWVGLWALAIFRIDRILATPASGAPDHWIALLALVGSIVGLARFAPSRPEGDPGAPLETSGQWGLAWRTFRRHRTAMLGLWLVAGLALVALLTPYIAPFDPALQGDDIVATRFQPPSFEHPMGTDRFGRDVFSRVLYGGRVSLGIGGLAVAIAVTLGSLVGAVSGYLRGWVDALSMRTVDLLLSFPRLVLLITIVALVQPSVLIITLVLGLTGWMGTSRLVRGEVLSLREREFVQAAKALGFGAPRILLRHILPNVASPIIVAATLGIGNTILVEASLSFLGLGVPPPAPSWGLMVAAGKDVMLDAPWIALFPGLAIVVTVMSFNLVGDGLRDALDPRSTTGLAP
ncbi:MAG: ABC transporter permease [Gemmatimonadota bacterium]|nr:ABC transporter permease [Gemmatimonadota bacterium]